MPSPRAGREWRMPAARAYERRMRRERPCAPRPRRRPPPSAMSGRRSRRQRSANCEASGHAALLITFCPERALAPLEQLVESPLPLALLIGPHQNGDHLLVRESLDDPGRIRGHILAGGKASEPGQKFLALLTEHEVGGEARGIGMWCLHIHADLSENQRDRIERPHIDWIAGKLHVHG